MRKLARSSSLLVLAALGAVACARIAGLDTTGGQGVTSGKDAGSLKTDEGAVITPASVAIAMPCSGSGTSSDPVQIYNDSDAPLTFAVESNGTDSALSLVAAGGSPVPKVEGTIAPKHYSPKISVVAAQGTVSTKLSLLVTINEAQHLLPVTAVTEGGSLTLTYPVIDFGNVHQDAVTKDETVSLVNTGTEPISVTGWAPAGSDFTFGTATLNIDPGATATTTVRWHAPAASTAPVEAKFAPTTGKPLCAPPSLTLKGTPVSTQVTVNPATVNFGDISCRQSGRTQTFTITNYSDDTADFSISAPTAFAVAPSTGTATKTSPATITVTANASTTPGDVSESVTVTITGPAIAPKPSLTQTVQIGESVRGALLEVSDIPVTVSGVGKSQSFRVKNIGNEDTNMSISIAPSGGFEVGYVPLLFAKAPFTNYVSVRQKSAGPITATATISADGLCTAPPTVALTGQ